MNGLFGSELNHIGLQAYIQYTYTCACALEYQSGLLVSLVIEIVADVLKSYTIS